MDDSNVYINIDRGQKASQIQETGNKRQKTIERIRLDLSIAATWTNPYDFVDAFKSIFVEKVSDSAAFCYFKPNSKGEDQKHCQLAMRDSFTSDLMTAAAYFSWPAQAGKWMEIVVFYDASFQSGSYTQISSGGVSVSEGTSTTLATVTLGAAVAGIIAPANSTRNTATIQNKTGADLYVGDSTVTNAGATEGIKIPVDGIIDLKNSSALYGYSVAGGKVSRIEEA